MRKKRTAAQTLLLVIAVIVVLLNRVGILQLPQGSNQQATSATQGELAERTARPTAAFETTASPADEETY